MITNPARITQRKITNIATALSRGVSVKVELVLLGLGVARFSTLLGDGVTGMFVVVTGNMRVIAGRGNKVVVGVDDGVAEGV